MRNYRILALTVAVVVALTVAGSYVLGSELSRPVPARIGSPPDELNAESVEFSSESGSTIHGWLSKGAEKHGTVLLLPGVRANRRSMLSRARMLHAAGYSTLLIDFQATGESPGDAITFGWRERLDVLAAVGFLKKRDPLRPIGVIGTSLGGAATLLAVPALDVQAVALEAVYPSIEVALANRIRMRVGSVGAALSPLLLLQLGPRFGVSASELRPIDRIGSLRCPLLIVAGTDDRHTTVADTEQLFGAAHEPKELWLVRGAGHVDYLAFAGAEYQRRVLEFLGRSLGRWRAADKPTSGAASTPARQRHEHRSRLSSTPLIPGSPWQCPSCGMVRL